MVSEDCEDTAGVVHMDRQIFQAYVVTDRESGKRYVGITGRTMSKRWNAHGSKSNARKAASAMIAKIPFALARHIGRVWWPRELIAP